MAAARSKNPAVGSAQWILDERHQSNDLVAQELEDFGFSVRNELEWLNEHMAEIFAHNGQSNLDVFKTPGKLRGKTPRTARKKAAETRQPLGDIFSANSQHRPSPALQSLRNNLQKQPKARFQIAEDTENIATLKSPVAPSPARQLFSKTLGKGKENRDSPYRTFAVPDEPVGQLDLGSFPVPPQSSPLRSTQDTAPDTQEDTVFTHQHTQSTQATQATQSFQRSIQTSEDERRDTGESFVSAKEYGSKNASKENLRADFDDEVDAMDLVDDRPEAALSDAQDTVIRHAPSSIHEDEVASDCQVSQHAETPRLISENWTISAETDAAFESATHRAQQPEPKSFVASPMKTPAPIDVASEQDDTVVHHDVEDQMDIDDDDEDIRSPSDGSSPVKPLVRKSSLTFASLPAREPLLAKKSMGNRISRTSHVDQNKARNSHLGRFTGGKSLGGSQHTQPAASYNDDMDIDEERPELRREESETTKVHNHTYTKSIKDRINMLGQDNEPPKRISQNITTSQISHTNTLAPPVPTHTSPAKQPTYPNLPAGNQAMDIEEDDDDWISPIRPTAPAAHSRPQLAKSYSADTRPVTAKPPALMKPISVSNPDIQAGLQSTTPVGSPTGKKYADNGPLSASKAKLYSALRAAKGILIGSSATSAQAKLDALVENSARPKLEAQSSSEDIFSSPKRNAKPGLFSHLRSPSKESLKSTKSKISAMPGSPTKEDGRRTRSSSERERQKEKETHDKETKEKRKVDDRLRELREKEQSKAAAHYQKTKAATKTPVAATSQTSFQSGPAAAYKTPTAQQQPSRPGTTRMNTAPRQEDHDSADEMPPPPPPKSFLPTGTGQKLREPKRLVKTSSKDALAKAKPQAPQKIQVNLHGFGQSSRTASKTVAPAPVKAVPASKPTLTATRPAAVTSKPLPAPKVAPAPKPVARMGRPQTVKAVEKPRPVPAPAQQRADLGTARPMSRMQTVQDANRINVPPMNPAKPAKRPFQAEKDEPLHRPAKRPSQQAKSKPVPMTPAHAQFAQGKIPFAEPAQMAPPPPPPPTIQYPNSEDIKLPDIMTDSEDEDSENEFQPPSWANTPNLREMLEQQQLIDPETIFGPIPPLNMEQVFPNRERHKEFRKRTSSAYWAHDGVTEEEKRKERAARERLAREGAWTYNPSPLPAPRPGPSR